MKRALSLTLASMLALPLLAEEPKKSEPQPAAATAQPGDSPLVQAARRSTRKSKKTSTLVFTNESLKKSQGHVSTSNAAAPVPAPAVPQPKPGPEAEIEARNARRAAELKKNEEYRAKAKAKSDEERLKRRAEAAAALEEGLYDGTDVDPAQAEHDAEKANSGKPPVH
ncbi:MAG: hypothetical protein M3Q69_11205 [Acidobacteriota bacterium]|nr:hypothetical protein [Acidobacteriota bacterium]